MEKLIQHSSKTFQNKLVRDRIPEIIRQSGRECGVETMDEEEFRQALRAKLVEEAQEAAAAIDADLVTELADLCEVMDALMVASGIDRETVLKEQNADDLSGVGSVVVFGCSGVGQTRDRITRSRLFESEGSRITQPVP